MELPNPVPVLDLTQAFRRSKSMFNPWEFSIVWATARLTPQRSLRSWDANADALQRLLDACVAPGLLEKEGPSFTDWGDASSIKLLDTE